MRILHTADWHLGDRLGRIDRTDDLRRAVERVGEYCLSERVDVLLVAGDLFSELARAEALRETIEHWKTVFLPFLTTGGTILTLTGNHDNENFCQTLHNAMNLAAPLGGAPGEEIAPGRFYLATEPTLVKLRDRSNQYSVQFLLMPYPTPIRYAQDENAVKTNSPVEKQTRLMEAFVDRMRKMLQPPHFDAALPSVLGAHINVRGAEVGGGLFRLTEQEDVIVSAESLPSEFAYVALGHVHKPQLIAGRTHIRYSGSIERMDLGEATDDKGVVIVEVGAQGLIGEPIVKVLPATRIYEIEVVNPREDLPRLAERYTEATDDLVNLKILYRAGEDIIDEVLRELERIFPRYYARDWKAVNDLGQPLHDANTPVDQGRSFVESVRNYVEKEIEGDSEEDREAIRQRLDDLLAKEEKQRGPT